MSEAFYKNPYGSSAAAARWNPHGARMIYASSQPSLALLEYLCIKGTAVSRRPWFMIVFDIPDASLIEELDATHLPDDWNALPHGQSTQEFGGQWLRSGGPPFLKVPSARMDLRFYPDEHNVLVNADWPELAKVMRVVDVMQFSYRLADWRRGGQ